MVLKGAVNKVTQLEEKMPAGKKYSRRLNLDDPPLLYRTTNWRLFVSKYYYYAEFRQLPLLNLLFVHGYLIQGVAALTKRFDLPCSLQHLNDIWLKLKLSSLY